MITLSIMTLSIMLNSIMELSLITEYWYGLNFDRIYFIVMLCIIFLSVVLVIVVAPFRQLYLKMFLKYIITFLAVKQLILIEIT
jgi:hypothetical protein